MRNLNCCYAEDCRFDSFFGWLRTTQHCKNGSQRVVGCNPVLSCSPTVTCSPKSETKVAKKFKRKSSIPNQFCLNKNDNFQINQYIEMSLGLNPSSQQVHLRWFSCIEHAKTTLSMQRQPRGCNNIPHFFNKPHLLHVLFVKVLPGTIFTCWSKQHCVVIGKAEQQVCKPSHCGTKQE